MLQECQVQVERLPRLAVETRDEIQPGQKDRHPAPAPFPPHRVHHADRLEAAVRVDVEVVRPVTRGSADSSPNDNELPGEASRARSRIAAIASSGCASIIAGSPLSVCSTLRSGAAERMPSSNARITGTLMRGVGEVPSPIAW